MKKRVSVPLPLAAIVLLLFLVSVALNFVWYVVETRPLEINGTYTVAGSFPGEEESVVLDNHTGHYCIYTQRGGISQIGTFREDAPLRLILTSDEGKTSHAMRVRGGICLFPTGGASIFYPKESDILIFSGIENPPVWR
ncbi:MAG: hypothetical protein ABT01_06780 [Clostridium sp. SCN 57-10]|nr:MAG: hypothetical protein ABT01_06780 [Clostridium sp. SCN 57-10]